MLHNFHEYLKDYGPIGIPPVYAPLFLLHCPNILISYHQASESSIVKIFFYFLDIILIQCINFKLQVRFDD